MGKTVIIGAGLAGLSAAYHAQQKGVPYDLYEGDAAVGGCCRSVGEKGFLFDYSGHLLHLKDPYFQGLVRELLGDNLVVLHRNAVIYSHGAFTRYPFQANLHGLPAGVVKECLLSFVRSYYENEDLPTRAYATFRDWIVAKLGEGIGEHFMFPYNEKLWTVPTEEMTCEWMSEYVPKPSLEDVFNGALEDQSKGFGYNATFWYPRQGGIQALCDALAGRVGNLHLNRRVTAVDLAANCVRFASGETAPYRRLVSTMPLKGLVGLLAGEVPEKVLRAAAQLRHNSVLIVNLGVRGADLTDKHWIYLPERRFTAYRVGVYSNFSAALAPPGTTSYYLEIGYRPEWNVDKEALAAKAVAEMAEIGLVRDPKDILVRQLVDLDHAYVIYDANHASARQTVLDFLARHDIVSVGRYGNWEYSGMEEALAQGKGAV
ncbi:protoporphyrinogen/coproporphyrinogen oxidase [Geomesophilobacter sediminis]|uniref:FAD-dependent oxidoreductase n=1 Tax=Geomesophilobacter sediminis TaxID=2798584 RepID=A0A8J7JE81_9BACT|nr:FAD-dependent oxidoreductase [Geomesophilobacter sediminis]MBJ6724254.1 FAD-dependent oxidoreductase [Geomesophilobacter sediminis]